MNDEMFGIFERDYEQCRAASEPLSLPARPPPPLPTPNTQNRTRKIQNTKILKIPRKRHASRVHQRWLRSLRLLNGIGGLLGRDGLGPVDAQKRHDVDFRGKASRLLELVGAIFIQTLPTFVALEPVPDDEMRGVGVAHGTVVRPGGGEESGARSLDENLVSFFGGKGENKLQPPTQQTFKLTKRRTSWRRGWRLRSRAAHRCGASSCRRVSRSGPTSRRSSQSRGRAGARLLAFLDSICSLAFKFTGIGVRNDEARRRNRQKQTAAQHRTGFAPSLGRLPAVFLPLS